MGFLLFGLGNALAITGLVLAAMGQAHDLGAPWIVALIGLGELVILASVLVLGDDGYTRLQARGAGLTPEELTPTPAPTTIARHRLGVSLLIVHLALYFLVWTGGILAYSTATERNPLPVVFGVPFEMQGTALIWGVVAAELTFGLAIYVLGPSWWERFKELFRYRPSRAPTELAPATPPPTLRYRLGMAVFAIGNALAVTGLLLPALGFAEGRMIGVIAVIMGAGEVISLSSIFLLGKEGFKQLKARLFAVLKRTPSGKPISRRRHRVGCSMIALHLVAQLAALVFPIASHYGAAPDGTFATVFGLGRQEQLQWFVGLLVASEVLFFAGIYTLGADWWGRFHRLFAARD